MSTRSSTPSSSAPPRRSSAKSKSSSSEGLRNFRYVPSAELDGMRRSELVDYVGRLHRLLRRTGSKMRKYKDRCARLKKKRRSKAAATSDSDPSSSDGDEPAPASAAKYKQTNGDQSAGDDGEAVAEVAEDPLSFVNDMKNTAEQMSGFVYEPTSGLYYDCKTGYYYNSEHNLYYDGNNGCYYSYDKATNKFAFHSQAYASTAAEATAGQPTTSAEPAAADHASALTDAKPAANKKPSTQAANATKRPSSATRGVKCDKQRRRERRSRSRRSRSSSADEKEDRRQRAAHSCSDDAADREDGELSSEDASDASDVQIVSEADAEPVAVTDVVAAPAEIVAKVSVVEPQTYEDIARKYPPSLRLVVLETVQPKLRIGQLFLITYKGGSLGREGAHDVIIPDINVSKFHLAFKYNHDESRYDCTDLGSRNGTLLNGRRMSNAKQESDALPIVHGAIIGLSQTRLLCHIHEGHNTCSECDPGSTMQMSFQTQTATGISVTTSTLLGGGSSSNSSSSQQLAAGGSGSAWDDGGVSVSAAATTATPVPTDADGGAYLTHKQELKKLKKRYGLAEEKWLIPQCTMAAKDRSAIRRAKVGSSDGNEKTVVASVNTNIAASNKGFKMLAKLGWSAGQKLGKNDSGLLEPVALVSNTGTKGLGSDAPTVQPTLSAQKRADLQRKTQERFKQTAAVDNIFGDDGELDV